VTFYKPEAQIKHIRDAKSCCLRLSRQMSTPTQMVYHPATAQGPPPPPMAAILEPLPKERRIQRRLAKGSEKDAKKEAIESKKAMRRGVLGSLMSLTEEIGHSVSSGISSGTSTVMDKYQSWDYNQSNKFFQEKFGSFLPTETLWDAAGFCRVTTGDTPVTGAAFVSTNHLSFYGYVSRSQVLQFSIPLGGIASVQRASTLRRSNAGLPPLLQVRPSPSVDTDGLLVYTTDGLVHQFHSFARTKTLENLLNVLDHAWRAVLASRGSQVFVTPAARPPVMQPIVLPTAPSAAPSFTVGAAPRT